MNPAKQKLLDRIDDDREQLIEYLREFIRRPSPNPPGDTLACAALVGPDFPYPAHRGQVCPGRTGGHASDVSAVHAGVRGVPGPGAEVSAD